MNFFGRLSLVIIIGILLRTEIVARTQAINDNVRFIFIFSVIFYVLVGGTFLNILNE